MFDHLLGRPPGPAYKRSQILAIVLFWIWIAWRGSPGGPRWLYIRKANRSLTRLTPWQIILSTLSLAFALRQWDVLLGLSAPEPLARLYSRSYYRAVWIATGFDAGFATAMTVRPKWLRDLSSVVFSLYYILYSSAAEEKLRKLRAVCTVDMLRATWNKTTNPYIRAFTFWDRPSLPIARTVTINRPLDSAYTKPITGLLFFSRSERELKFATELILDFPGGGFIAMNPHHHEERLRRWAVQTGRPVLAVNYGKAPEYPYPYALEECFDLYRTLVRSKGQIIGMSGQRLDIIMSGDSAGGNIAANVMFKILESPSSSSIPRPVALVLNYPALDFGFTSWMSPAHLSVLRAEHQQSSSHIQGLAEQKDHFGHKSPLAVVSDTARRPSSKISRQKSWAETLRLSSTEPERKQSMPSHSHVRKRRSTLFRERVPSVDEEVDGGHVADSEHVEDMQKTEEGEKPQRVRVQVPEPSEEDAVQKKKPFATRLTMTSRVGYFQDKIISPSMMRAMAILYIGPHQNPDFETDYRLSPILAPDELLAQFPPLLIMCGEKDPFVDDSVIFTGRVREAKRARLIAAKERNARKSRVHESLRMTSRSRSRRSRSRSSSDDARLLQESDDDWVQLEIIEGWSHGYLQMTALMGEVAHAIEQQAEWMEDVFVGHYQDRAAPRNDVHPAFLHDPVVSSETEIEEPISFVPKSRRMSSFTTARDDMVRGSQFDEDSDAENSSETPRGVPRSPPRLPSHTAGAVLPRSSLLTGVAPVLTNANPQSKALLAHHMTDSPVSTEMISGGHAVSSRPLTAGMVSVKEVDLMKRRRLDAVLGMEETDLTSPIERR